MVGPGRPQFVLFGSSIVQLSYSDGGWGSILSDIYSRKADILLRGYYGWNSRRALQVLDQIFPKDAAVQPALVIVYFGGNDSMGPHPSGLGPHVPLSEYVENMKKIGEHLKGLSDTTRIIFLSCPPVNEKMFRQGLSEYFSELVRTNELCQAYSEACVELCKEIGVEVVDLFRAIQSRPDWANKCFTDGVHLSEEGSKVVVEEILKVLKQVDWNPSLHWKSMPTEFAEDSPCDLVAADGKRTINPSEWTFHRAIQDGVHLSEEGSKVVVEEILKVLRRVDWKPSLHWKSLPTEFAEDSPYYLVAADGKRSINPSEWTHRGIQWISML